MGLPKKGSRLITVDGVVYRWLATHELDFSREDPLYWPVSLAVERAVEPGQRVLVSFRVPPRREWVTPGVVRRIILAALERGWRPAARSLPPLEMTADEEFFEQPPESD